VRDTEKNLAERSEVRIVAIGNARAEEIRGERAVRAAAENIVAVIAAEISNAAKPAVGVVGDGRAAAVKIETVYARSSGISADVGISGEKIELGNILRGCDDAEQ